MGCYAIKINHSYILPITIMVEVLNLLIVLYNFNLIKCELLLKSKIINCVIKSQMYFVYFESCFFFSSSRLKYKFKAEIQVQGCQQILWKL